jgi:hypothetical protein
MSRQRHDWGNFMSMDLHNERAGTVRRYDPFTGRPAGSSGEVFAAAALGLEPPRYCEWCGRRMVVQVSPDGWWATCSRHGFIDSTEDSKELGRR